MSEKRHRLSLHETGKVHRSDPETTHLSHDCLDVGDNHYCAAATFTIGHRISEDLDTIVLLAQRGSAGLAWQVTPKGARDFAEALNRCADLAEARMTKRANAQLAATLAKRTP